MKSPRAWVEEDILTLIRDREMESLTLEYKSCSSLSKTDDRIKTEISRDVSAFANAAGGVLIYGVVEKRREHLPEKIDEGFDPADINKDWLEQVINSRIHPRLDEYYIIPVELTSAHPGRVAYVVEIPQSVTRPPHQAHDHVYYRRYGSEVLAMEDYEIRDVMNRSRVPDLNIEIKREQSPEDGSGNVRLHLTIWNRGQVMAKYVSCVCVVVESSYLMASAPLTFQKNLWRLRDNRSIELIPNVDRVVFPDLSFDAGWVEFAHNQFAGAIPPHLEVVVSLFAEGMPRKQFRLTDVPTGVPPVYHYPPAS